MPRRILIIGTVLVLALMVAPAAFAAAGDEVTITGTVVEFDSEAGTITLETEDGTSYTIVVPEGFDFTSLEEGDILKVEGIEGDDGSVAASEVEAEDGDDGEMPFQHPAALKIEEEWGIPYDTVMDIFENGFTGANYGLEEGFGDYEGRVGFGRIMMAARLADRLDPTGELGLTWEWLLGWHLSGNGWGQVMVSYKLADKLGEETGLTGADLLEYRENGGNWGDVHQAARVSAASGETVEALLGMRADGMKWGQIRKELGLSGPPEGHGNGKPEDSPGKGKDKPEDHPGKGKDKPEDHPGKGKGKDKDKPGKGKDK